MTKNTSKDGKVIAEHGGAEHNTLHNTFQIRKSFSGAGWKYSLSLAASFALFGFIVFLVRTIIG